MIEFREFIRYNSINETIQFNKGANYGQIVILAGGPASGKGFVKSWFLDVKNYKSRDIDDFKKKFLKLIHKRKTLLDTDELQILKRLHEAKDSIKEFLKNESNVALIHLYVQNKINKKLDSSKIKNNFNNYISQFFKNKGSIDLSKDKLLVEELKSTMESFIEKELGRYSNSILENYFNEHFNNFISSITDSITGIRDITKKLYEFLIEILKSEDFYPKDIDYIQKVASQNAENLPNLLFDITFNNAWYLQTVISKFVDAGYKPENIHLVWVVVDLEKAEERNKTRERVVPKEIVLKIHAEVIENVLHILASSKFIPSYLNGDIYIIDNKDLDAPLQTDRTLNKDTSSYKDASGSTSFNINKNDIIKIKIKSANNPTVDLDQLVKIESIIKKNIMFLEQETHLRTHLDAAKKTLDNMK